MAGAAYWVGADGNVYARGDTYLGVQNLGRSGGVSAGGGHQVISRVLIICMKISLFLIRILHALQHQLQLIPAAQAQLPPIFNQAGAQNTQLTIDQIPALLQAAQERRYPNQVV